MIGHLNIHHAADGELSYLAPEALLAADETLTGETRLAAQARLTDWLRLEINRQLEPLKNLQNAELSGLARGLAFQLLENKGCLPRRDIAEILNKLDQDLRATLRKCGVRFGFYHVFMPALLKPAPARLLALLSLIESNMRRQQRDEKPRPLGETLAQLPAAGLTSSQPEKLPGWLYRAAGFYTCRARVIRFDMLERLADIIRPLLAENRDGFEANEAMMSIMGCGAEELHDILTALGYQPHEVAKPTPAAQSETQNPTASDPQAEQASQQAAEQASKSVETAAETVAETSGATEAGAEAAPAGEETLVLWRPAPRKHNARKDRNHRDQNRKRRPSDKSAGAIEQAAGKSRPAGAMRKSGPKNPRKTADPSSPFAVLKQLQNKDGAQDEA